MPDAAKSAVAMMSNAPRGTKVRIREPKIRRCSLREVFIYAPGEEGSKVWDDTIPPASRRKPQASTIRDHAPWRQLRNCKNCISPAQRRLNGGADGGFLDHSFHHFKFSSGQGHVSMFGAGDRSHTLGNCVQSRTRTYQYSHEIFLRDRPVGGMDKVPPAPYRVLDLRFCFFTNH